MDKLLLLKGKLEMAKRTISLQKTSSKKTHAIETESVKKSQTLVYRDAPD